MRTMPVRGMPLPVEHIDNLTVAEYMEQSTNMHSQLLESAEVSMALQPCSPAVSLPPDRRGRLRNGATPGDFLAAPRCGARTRAGACCRQPAMKNGRCRMHGGLSTGPRTAEGRARCAAARRTHGFYAAEMVALRRAGAAHCRRMDALFASLRIRRTAHGISRPRPIWRAPGSRARR